MQHELTLSMFVSEAEVIWHWLVIIVPTLKFHDGRNQLHSWILTSMSAVILTLMKTTFLQHFPVKDHLAMG